MLFKSNLALWALRQITYMHDVMAELCQYSDGELLAGSQILQHLPDEFFTGDDYYQGNVLESLDDHRLAEQGLHIAERFSNVPDYFLRLRWLTDRLSVSGHSRAVLDHWALLLNQEHVYRLSRLPSKTSVHIIRCASAHETVYELASQTVDNAIWTTGWLDLTPREYLCRFAEQLREDVLRDWLSIDADHLDQLHLSLRREAALLREQFADKSRLSRELIDRIHDEAVYSHIFFDMFLPGSQFRSDSFGIEFSEWYGKRHKDDDDPLYKYTHCASRDPFAIGHQVIELGRFKGTSHHQLIAKMAMHASAAVEWEAVARRPEGLSLEATRAMLSAEQVMRNIEEAELRQLIARVGSHELIADVDFAHLNLEYEHACRRCEAPAESTPHRAQPEAPPPPPHEDGPEEPDAFWWANQKYDGLRPRLWAMLNAVWQSGNRRVPFNEVADVWAVELPSDKNIQNCASKLATWFIQCKIPLSVRTKERWVILEEN